MQKFKKLTGLFPYLLLLVLVGVLLYRSWQNNGQQFIYPLDDTYIHLSLAKQLATEGNWGLSPEHFNSCGSSLLYVLILAGSFKLWGTHDSIPLLINLMAALGVLFLLKKYLHQLALPVFYIPIILSLIVLLAPLHLLVLCGMEHSLQLVISLAFVWHVAGHIKQNKSSPYGLLFILASLSSAIRYEGLFLILAAVCLLFFYQRWISALFIAFAGALPVVIYGFISLSKGSYFFPNSILSKGNLPINSLQGISAWLMHAIDSLYEHPFIWLLLVLLGGSLLAIWLRENQSSFELSFGLMVLGALVLHIFFAEVGGYRYEAYLILLGFISLIISLQLLFKNIPLPRLKFSVLTSSAFIALGIGLLFPFIIRSGFFTANYVLASQNIYQQQYQMARFLASYYPKASVAANDVGAITYFTDIQLLDLVGIGGNEIIKARAQGPLTGEVIAQIARNKKVQIAIVHDIWVENRLPNEWKRVARWTIPDNFICADESVSFYGVDAREAMKLWQHLQAFEADLPEQVVVSYE